MITGAALAAASGGAWGANAIANIDPCGCFLWKAGTLPGSADGSFVPCGIPFITGKNFAFSRESTPLAILHFEKADGNNTGNMISPSMNKGNPDWVATRKERGLYNPDKLPVAVKTAIHEVADVQVNVVVQYIPAGDLYFRPELAIHSDLITRGSFTGWSWGVFGPSHINERDAKFKSPIIDEQPAEALKKDLQAIGAIAFNNAEFCTKPCEGLKIANKADVELKSHFSFWTVLKKDDKAFVTSHWVILSEHLAQEARQQLRVVSMAIKHGGNYEDFAAIYNTDAVGKANLIALYKELGHQNPPTDTDTRDALQDKWNNIIPRDQNNVIAKLYNHVKGLGAAAFINYSFNWLRSDLLKHHGRAFYSICN
jgi:hypothetical protein